METVSPSGELIDHFDGRTLNPGHAIEGAWFIMLEGKLRDDDSLIRTGCEMLDWMWERGWDEEYGGILYFVDVKGLPVQEYWHDMKFWWPHTEAIIATLLAYQLTGNPKYADWHKKVHDWTYSHFPDPRTRRMVRLSAPRRSHQLNSQRQSLERPLPYSPHATDLLANAGRFLTRATERSRNL